MVSGNRQRLSTCIALGILLLISCEDSRHPTCTNLLSAWVIYLFNFYICECNFKKIVCKPYSTCYAGYSRTKREFNCHYERIRERGQIYTDWLDQIPREKWVQAFDGGHRWGHMTTNLVECMNSVLKEARNLPITILVRATYFQLGELFA